MTDPLEWLFERSRRDGEPEASRRVFDATAPRLQQLAIHLAGDLGAAEERPDDGDVRPDEAETELEEDERRDDRDSEMSAP